jgi:hypothetical protein
MSKKRSERKHSWLVIQQIGPSTPVIACNPFGGSEEYYEMGTILMSAHASERAANKERNRRNDRWGANTHFVMTQDEYEHAGSIL